MAEINSREAWKLLTKYNKEEFHLGHARAVGLVMRWFAEHEGFENEADFWEVVGILHDIDYELYPDEHCKKAHTMLQELGLDETLIHAVVSHGFGICYDVEPKSHMEKVLFAVDELTGLIGAAALMRPSKSVQDMELKSLKKKFKDKKFAAGCSRDTISQGAERLGWDINELLQKTLDAMSAVEEKANNPNYYET